MSLEIATGSLPRGSLWTEQGSGVVLLGDGRLSGELTGDSGRSAERTVRSAGEVLGWWWWESCPHGWKAGPA